METVEFLFGPNPGEPSKPLRLIASSGELARIMLAIKSALAHKDATPLLVFDEIDANVGGEVARAVGFKMQQLGNRHQVISITHFPQVQPWPPIITWFRKHPRATAPSPACGR